MNPYVLVVHGDSDELDALRRMLDQDWCTWNVEFADNPATALAILDRAPIDVIVAQDEGDLLSEVRRRHRGTARLVLSGESTQADFARIVSVAHQFVRQPCRPDDLRVAVGRAVQLRSQLDVDQLLSDVSEVDVLPSPPAVFQELVAAADNPDIDAKGLAKVIERDVALSAKILQLSNSAYFAPKSRITSLERGVMFLGIRVIRSLILTEHIQRDFVGPPAVQRWLTQLNDHGYESARLARLVAPAAKKDDAFCAALLHECGQLVFARGRPGIFAAHLAIREERACSLAEVEVETFGFTHAQAGAYLLSLWGFPADLVEAVACHDEAPAADRPRDLVQSVQLAHRVAEAKVNCVCGPAHDAGEVDWPQIFGIEREVAEWTSGD